MPKALSGFKQRFGLLLKTAAADEDVLKEMRNLLVALDPGAKRACLSIGLGLAKKHKRLGVVLGLYKTTIQLSEDLAPILIDAVRWCRSACKGKEPNDILKFVKHNVRLLSGSADSMLPVISEETQTLVHFKRFSSAIGRLITASQFFSRFGAYQSAYRALAEAETIARANFLHRDLARVVFALSVVASDEGDKGFAEKHFAKAIQLLEERSLPVPASYRLNHASMLMQLDKPDEAEPIFESMLKQTSDARTKFALLTNLAICKRTTTSLQASVDEIRKGQEFIGHCTHPEEIAEFHLVAAKTFLLTRDGKKASRHIERALDAINMLISAAARLHYRRGVRENYVPRIRSMVRPCFDLGMRKSLLACLAFAFNSTAADWCHYLEWCEASLKDDLVPKWLKQRLMEALKKITDFGPPVVGLSREIR